MAAYPAPAVAQTDPTAVMGRRILAFLIDTVIVGVIFFVAFFALAETHEGVVDPTVETKTEFKLIGDQHYFYIQSNNEVREVHDSEFWTVMGITWGYYFVGLGLLQGATGATPGKAITGIRVVGNDGRAPGVGRGLLRQLLWIVDDVPYIFPLVALISSLATTGHRRVGDLVAGTRVVARAAANAGAAATPVGAMGPPGAPQWDPARGTYIQWDPGRGVWLQWSTAQQQWTPI